jgi:hypothetical protein
MKLAQGKTGEAALEALGSVPSPVTKTAALGLLPMVNTTLRKVRHASPYAFEKFKLDPKYINTGEGSQVEGIGHFFSTDPNAHAYYKRFFSRKRLATEINEPKDIEVINTLKEEYPSLYKEATDWFGKEDSPKSLAHFLSNVGHNKKVVSLLDKYKAHEYDVVIDADPKKLLDFDVDIGSQPKNVQNFATDVFPILLRDAGLTFPRGITKQDVLGLPGSLIMNEVRHQYANDLSGKGLKTWQDLFKNYNIHGAKYIGDDGLNVPKKPNFVIWDDDKINIMKRYGLAGLLFGGAGLAGMSSKEPEKY